MANRKLLFNYQQIGKHTIIHANKVVILRSRLSPTLLKKTNEDSNYINHF